MDKETSVLEAGCSEAEVEKLLIEYTLPFCACVSGNPGFKLLRIHLQQAGKIFKKLLLPFHILAHSSTQRLIPIPKEVLNTQWRRKRLPVRMETNQLFPKRKPLQQLWKETSLLPHPPQDRKIPLLLDLNPPNAASRIMRAEPSRNLQASTLPAHILPP